MNSYIRVHKAKLTYFTEHFKELIKVSYDEYIINLNSKKDTERNKYSIARDIIDFLIKIKIENKTFTDLLQLKKEEDDIIYTISNRILILLFDFDLENTNNN